jgi:hypothetical protein
MRCGTHGEITAVTAVSAASEAALSRVDRPRYRRQTQPSRG